MSLLTSTKDEFNTLFQANRFDAMTSKTKEEHPAASKSDGVADASQSSIPSSSQHKIDVIKVNSDDISAAFKKIGRSLDGWKPSHVASVTANLKAGETVNERY